MTFKEKVISFIKDINLFEYVGLFFVAQLLIVADILTKYYAYFSLVGTEGSYVTLIPHILDLTLVYNNGAAWNILSDQKWLLCMISLIVGSALVYIYFTKFDKMPRFIRISFSLMIAGAFGNLIDRIGYWGQLGIYKHGVIDFLLFDFWKSFPVFNLADSYLVIGIAIILIGYFAIWLKQLIKNKKEHKSNDDPYDISDINDVSLDSQDKTEEKKADDTKEEKEDERKENNPNHS